MSQIEISKYEYQITNLRNSMLVAIVSDLHDRCADEVIRILESEMPDLIIMPGDTFVRHNPEIAGNIVNEMHDWQQSTIIWRLVCKWIKWFSDLFGFTERKRTEYKESNGRALITVASKIAPIIISRGNHEWYFSKEDKMLFSETGAHLLDNANISLTINGNSITFGGLSTKHDLLWLHEFSKIEGIKILLCHHPEYYNRYIKGTDLDTVDLIISGHAHGGQWRLLGRGVFAPGQGVFPKYTKGIYGKMVVSAGLSNTAIVHRINNPREVVFLKCRK